MRVVTGILWTASTIALQWVSNKPFTTVKPGWEDGEEDEEEEGEAVAATADMDSIWTTEELGRNSTVVCRASKRPKTLFAWCV